MRVEEYPPFTGDKRTPEYLQYQFNNPMYAGLTNRIKDTGRPKITNEDGTFSTERMMTAGFDDKYYLFPSMFTNEKGELEEYSDANAAFTKARELGQFMEFDNLDDAEYVSQNYKSIFQDEYSKLSEPIESATETPKTIPKEGFTGMQGDTALETVQEVKKEVEDVIEYGEEIIGETRLGSNRVKPPSKEVTTSPIKTLEEEGVVPTDEEKQKLKEQQNAAKRESEAIKMLRETFTKDIELADKAKKMVLGKSIFDALMTTGQLVTNMLGKQPKTIQAPRVDAPVIPSTAVAEEQLLNRALAGGYAVGRKMATEMGRPEITTGVVANMMNATTEGRLQIGARETARQGQEAQIRAGVEGQNAQTQLKTDMYNQQIKERAAAGLSEANAKLLSNYSTTLSEYITSKVNIEDQENTARTWLAMLNNDVKAEDIMRMMSSLEQSRGRFNYQGSEFKETKS